MRRSQIQFNNKYKPNQINLNLNSININGNINNLNILLGRGKLHLIVGFVVSLRVLKTIKHLRTTFIWHKYWTLIE